jgi:hypothetical protein
LIDVECLVLLWRFTRRENIRLIDLVGVERSRLLPDTLLGFALVLANLLFILVCVYAAGWFVYGTLNTSVPLWRAAVAGCALRGAVVAVHLGAHRADDLQRLSGAPLSGSLPQDERRPSRSWLSLGRFSTSSCR